MHVAEYIQDVVDAMEKVEAEERDGERTVLI